MKALIVVLLAVLVVGCSQENHPTAPGPVVQVPPAQSKTVRGFTFDVPVTVRVGETRASRAIVKWSDDTTEDVTERVAWRSSFTTVAAIDERSGSITGLRPGDTQVWIEAFDGRSLQNSGGNYPAAPNRTIVEDPLDLRVVSPENGATLRLGRPNGDFSDRLMVATGTISTEWLRNNPTARIWVCFKNRPGFWIVGACHSTLAATGGWEFRPALWATNDYHRSVGETYEVVLFLTVGVDETSFYRLATTGDPYQRSDNDPAIVRSVTKPLRVSHR